MPEAAARLRDPISHTPSLGLLAAGALIGGGLAVLAVVTAPVSVPVLIGGAMIAGGAVAGAGIGEFVGGLSFARSVAGEIEQPGSPGVFVNRRRAARAHLDHVDCRQHGHGPVIAQGSDSVFIDGWNAARKGDRIDCDALIDAGSPDVVIGGGTWTTDAISPEVPDIVHKAMFVVGLGSAMVLFGPEMAILGLAGGLLGGKVMSDIGGAVFGEGSDGQKIMGFAGSIAGGLGAAKGGAWFNRNYQIRQTGLGMNGGGFSVTRRPPTGPIKKNEVTTFGDFRDRSVVGDKLEGHEVWQHANLNENGLAAARHASDASRGNPVIALDRDMHVQVNRAQRALDARAQTPRQNIDANVQILRDLKAAPKRNIDRIHRMAIDHATSQGH